MSKIDWKRKLSSRKFWLAIAGFITSILVAFSVDESIITKIASIFSATGIVCAYLFAEAKTDSEGGNNK